MQATKRIKTKYKGVYYRESESQFFKGKKDICYDITYKVNGKKIWEKIGYISEGYSEKLANDIRNERIRKIRHGEDLPKEKPKAPYFKDITAKYLEWASKNKSDSGIADISRYKTHIARRFDIKRMDQITNYDLEKLKAELFEKELSSATVKHCLVLIRQIYNKARQWGLYDGENPIQGVKMPILKNQKIRFFTKVETNILLNEIKKRSLQMYDICIIALYTGMRRQEIFLLKGHDIDLGNGLITISDPKNKESRKAYITENIKDVFIRRMPNNLNDYIFKGLFGGKINDLSKTFMRVIDKLEFNKGITDIRQKVSFHTLRHTFASWLALQGESLLTIKELLGHKTLDMTLRYSHLIPDHKRQAVRKLAELPDHKP